MKFDQVKNSLTSALRTLSLIPPPATARTADDPEIQEQITAAARARDSRNDMTPAKACIKNFAKLAALMGKAETIALTKANSAFTVEQKNEVYAAELVRRGETPVGGIPQPSPMAASIFEADADLVAVRAKITELTAIVAKRQAEMASVNTALVDALAAHKLTPKAGATPAQMIEQLHESNRMTLAKLGISIDELPAAKNTTGKGLQGRARFVAAVNGSTMQSGTTTKPSKTPRLRECAALVFGEDQTAQFIANRAASGMGEDDAVSLMFWQQHLTAPGQADTAKFPAFMRMPEPRGRGRVSTVAQQRQVDDFFAGRIQ